MEKATPIREILTATRELYDQPSSFSTMEHHYYPNTSRNDLNTLSQYLLNATAFTPNVSMCAGDHLRYENDEDLANTYAAISEGIAASGLFFRSRTEVTDHSTIDYDRISIIFERDEEYFVIMQPPQDWKAEMETINRGWLDKRRVGTHLISEWESLPKVEIGKHCLAAAGLTEGWWTLHSKLIMELREAFTFRALQLQSKRLGTKPCPYELKFKPVLTREFGYIVDRNFVNLRMEKLASEIEAESALREFTTIYDEDQTKLREQVSSRSSWGR